MFSGQPLPAQGTKRTPPTPAVVKGLHALNNPKEEVEAQKLGRCASRRYRFNAFFASPLKAPQSLRDSSPEGERALARSAALSQKAALQMPFPVTTPPVKMRLERSAELVGAKPLHLLTQTALPLKSPTGAFIAALRSANAVAPNAKI